MEVAFWDLTTVKDVSSFGVLNHENDQPGGRLLGSDNCEGRQLIWRSQSRKRPTWSIRPRDFEYLEEATKRATLFLWGVEKDDRKGLKKTIVTTREGDPAIGSKLQVFDGLDIRL
ncbi:7017_t:CDS:2 [Paraglomus brasilianum]|uniref:7017_t:CDS:1 n=1 Tax=Paraglomus brasilianum TaxID=144538 RepID=A0A9N8Z8N2_9GLOM|nr:7017_t:CDS:2 [Paraglomus brasilianum]